MKHWRSLFSLVVLVSVIWPVRPNDVSAAGGRLAEDATYQDGGAPAIYLRGLTITPDQGEPALAAQLAQSAVDSVGLHIVQFSGPIQPEWLAELEASGLAIVAYLPDFAYLVWGDQPAAQVEQAAQLGSIRWSGPYHPYYRLSPELRGPAVNPAPAVVDGETQTVEVTIQLYNSPLLKQTLDQVAQLAQTVLQPPTELGNTTYLRVRAAVDQLSAIAALPDVLIVESFEQPELLDEAQGQLMAGNARIEGGRLIPNGPGYLEWLNSKGFSQDPSTYPLVEMMDDGLDTGNTLNILHADFYNLGSKTNSHRVAYVTNCSGDPAGNSIGGHGNLNLGIMAGYNNQSGFPYADSNGYRLGLGISPYGQVAASKVFANSGAFDLARCGSSLTEMVRRSYENGARITTNSWGAPVGGRYTVDSQAYDFLTRDAAIASGNQEMLHIFAAGNSGPDTQTISSPASAKNVLTVGASENVRDHTINDGCYMAEGDSAGDVASFSSRGPTVDGRAKPDLIAPGTHVQGPASQDPDFNGSGVCGGMPGTGGFSPFYPSGQSLYTWSSGTSHSTPAVAGMAQLLYAHYQNVMMPGKTPSPAMLKALIVNTPRYLGGWNANDTLPSQNQGWGSADMGMALDGTPRILVDQSRIFRASGEMHQMVGQVQDLSKPLRISLVWTDAPGTVAAGRVGVNNLDLEVIVNGQIYRGNAFSGAYSTPNGAPDVFNNVENVFLPAGLQGSFQIRVIARNLAGDGVPNSGTLTDQDFALVVYNGVEKSAPVLAMSDLIWREVHGNSNGAIDPGETIEIFVALENQGNAETGTFSTTMRAADPNVMVLMPTVSYANIAPGAVQTNVQPFRIKIGAEVACNAAIPLSLDLTIASQSGSLALSEVTVGERIEHQYSASGVPIAIPDYNETSRTPGEVQLPVTVSDSFPITDLDAAVDLRHTWVSDLTLHLVSPSGAVIELSSRRGGMGDNYQGTIFDDQADTSITSAIPPFTGRYRPEAPLSALNGQPANGRWTLKVLDTSANDNGEVLGFALNVLQVRCVPYNPSVDLAAAYGNAMQSAMPGETVTFSVLVKNVGSTSDTFKLSTKSGWPVTMPATVGPISAGKSMPVEVKVTIPNSADTQQSQPVLITATSSKTPTNQADLALFVVVGHQLWMPLMYK